MPFNPTFIVTIDLPDSETIHMSVYNKDADGNRDNLHSAFHIARPANADPEPICREAAPWVFDINGDGIAD